MSIDDLDRILSEEEELVPSSGFVSSVMDAVRREATSPPPLAFPWKRALPGLAAAGVALVAAVVQVCAFLGRGEAPANVAVPFLVEPALQAAVSAGKHWVLLAVLVTAASMWFALRLTRRSA